MATLVVVLLCSKILLQSFPVIKAATHWIVTEDGRIQAQMDSVFSLRRPYDLVALLRQEERAVMLEHLKQELLTRKEEIDKNEDKDTGLEQRFYKTNPDCIAAGKPLPDFDLYISTVLPLENKGIRPEEHIDFKAPPTATPKAPYCTEVMDLTFSIHAFEHLEGMKDRSNLTGQPELGLKNAITHRDNVDDYGHLIFEALKKNKTSWVLYNMAAFYWRIKGDPYEVVECLRRALHYSPRMQKDVALISLANVLHRSRYSNEAAIVVHAALDVSKELNVNHFTLGNIYAVLAEYNKSVICFENTLKIQPDFQAAAKRKHAVLCHASLESALENQHRRVRQSFLPDCDTVAVGFDPKSRRFECDIERFGKTLRSKMVAQELFHLSIRSLQRTLNELRDYQRKHEYWQQQQKRLLSELELPDVRFDQRIAFEHHRLREGLVTTGEFCHMIMVNGKPELQCSYGRRTPLHHDLDYGWGSHEQPNPAKEERTPVVDTSMDYSKPLHEPLYSRKKHSNSSEKGQTELHKDKDWPNKEECDTYVQKFPSFTEFPTTYLPPENKGFEVQALLGEAQGLSSNVQHALPWYPPVCISIADIPEGQETYDHIQSVQDRNKIPARLSDTSLNNVLLGLVDSPDVTEAEVGQRILTALKRGIGPKWVLFNLAGLYWRINGNNYHGIECLRRAIYFAPPDYKDVPLVNLANILYKWGRVDDAVTVMRDAVKINDLEPETHFFLGNVLAAKTNITGAMWHYEEALNQEASHQGAFNMLRTVKCYNKFHRSAQSAVPKDIVTVLSPPNCKKGMQLKHPIKSRVVCENEKGQDTCFVETQAVGANCGNGACKQTCVVTPIRVENGGDPIKNCPNQSPTAADGMGNCDNVGSGSVEGASNNPSVMDPEINMRLDEISEYFRQKGACTGDDCHRLMVQNLNQQQRPHTRLEIINGILHQKLIFVESPADIIVKPTDCVIFNDGSKSSGCTREEFKPYTQHLSDLTKILSKPSTEESIHGNKPCSTDSADELVALDVHILQSLNDKFDVDLDEEEEIEEIIAEEDEEDQEEEEKKEEAETVSLDHVSFSDVDILKFNPDPARHIHSQADIEWPTPELCHQRRYKINFGQFVSTWVSVSTKGIDINTLLDFDGPVPDKSLKPECISVPQPNVLDNLPQIKMLNKLYRPELSLRDTLLKLKSGTFQLVPDIPQRIAKALKKNPDSWALSDLAALYWRVNGDSVQALKCIKVAYVNAPRQARDIALLSLANILHQTGLLDDALLVTNMALEASPRLVALHFTVANLYAAKEDWIRARQFYRSTLGLQSAFTPARDRLQAIRCMEVLSRESTKG